MDKPKMSLDEAFQAVYEKFKKMSVDELKEQINEHTEPGIGSMLVGTGFFETLEKEFRVKKDENMRTMSIL